MKLSDAAVLGAATWERVCYPVISAARAQTKGCFLQLALRAVGCSAKEVAEDRDERGVPLWSIKMAEFWPWTMRLTENGKSHGNKIWEMNDSGKPFEKILAYVRAYEPTEQPTAADTLESMVESDRDWSANTR